MFLLVLFLLPPVPGPKAKLNYMVLNAVRKDCDLVWLTNHALSWEKALKLGFGNLIFIFIPSFICVFCVCAFDILSTKNSWFGYFCLLSMIAFFRFSLFGSTRQMPPSLEYDVWLHCRSA